MLRVQAVPAFTDNYIWLIHGSRNKSVAIVDPGDHEPVLRALERDGLQPAAVLITHRHGDHVGGIRGLRARYPDLPVFGPARESIPDRSRALQEGDVVELVELGLRFTVWDVPGHTAGHIAYLGHGALFCGDTLFAAGCGRVFDGTLADLYRSLARIAALPADIYSIVPTNTPWTTWGSRAGWSRIIRLSRPAWRLPTRLWTRAGQRPAGLCLKNWPPIRFCASPYRRLCVRHKPKRGTAWMVRRRFLPFCEPGKIPSTTEHIMISRILFFVLLVSLCLFKPLTT